MDPVASTSLKQILEAIQRLQDEGQPGVLALITRTGGSSPGWMGAKMLVLPDQSIVGTVGGGALEARVIRDARLALEDGAGPRTRDYQLADLGMTCGGEVSVYLELIQPARRLVIYGGGHVSSALCRVLSTLGCRIRVVDERAEWANPQRFPQAAEIANLPFAEDLRQHPVGPADHVLIVTRGHQHDQLVLEGVIPRRPAYLGMIGSRSKAALALDKLRAQQVPAELVDGVRVPVGLNLGAVTPEEIAISVAAELVLFWRRGERGRVEPWYSGAAEKDPEVSHG